MPNVDLANVASFSLDHTKVRAPYVRLITTERGPRGDALTNFDVRLVQPNEGEIPTAGLHTIEHVLASLLRPRIPGLVDFSPFGCRTGFHLIAWGEPAAADVAAAVKASLEDLVERIFWDDVPGTTALECGNYRDHSLHSAKEWAKLILDRGISIDAFDRTVLA